MDTTILPCPSMKGEEAHFDHIIWHSINFDCMSVRCALG